MAQSDSKPMKLIVITGPTASGKTELALFLAKKFGGEIIVADSRQLYKGMDIGTNKPTKKEQRSIPHALLDILTPKSRFTAYDFQKKATSAIRTTQKRGNIPFVVGGTGLYIRALIDGLDFAYTKPDVKKRETLEKLSLKALIARLRKIDPKKLLVIDQKNPRRLIRAIEIAENPHSPYQKNIPHYDALQIALQVDRESLYKRINARVIQMMRQGLEKEVRTLLRSYSWALPAMSGIGYREFHPYFEKKITRDELIATIQKDTRKYAKRQLTWFKRDKRIHWVKNKKEALRLVTAFLQK